MRAFIFPGQGSQSVGMGQALAAASPAAREVFQEVDDALGQKLFALMTEGPAETLTLTENAQPAIMANAIATLRVLEQRRRHSAGRQSRLRRRAQPGRIYGLVRRRRVRSCEDREAAKIARARDAGGGAGGRGGDGGAARRRSRYRADDRWGDRSTRSWRKAARNMLVCAIANDNDPTQVVISGHRVAIERAVAMAKDLGAKRAILLPVSAPFHCRADAGCRRRDGECAGGRACRRAFGAAVLQRRRRRRSPIRMRSASLWSSR